MIFNVYMWENAISVNQVLHVRVNNLELWNCNSYGRKPVPMSSCFLLSCGSFALMKSASLILSLSSSFFLSKMLNSRLGVVPWCFSA